MMTLGGALDATRQSVLGQYQETVMGIYNSAVGHFGKAVSIETPNVEFLGRSEDNGMSI